MPTTVLLCTTWTLLLLYLSNIHQAGTAVNSPPLEPGFDPLIVIVRLRLQCLYVYEAPHLTIESFNIILEACPNLRQVIRYFFVPKSQHYIQFGNLSRWAVNCEGIQQIVRTVRNNNLEVEILCGSHWFQSTCAKAVSFGAT